MNISLRHKIVFIMLSVTIPVIGLGLGSVMIKNVSVFKQTMLDNSVMTARIIGNHAASDLFLEDEIAAREALTGLLKRSTIINAFLYDAQGTLFASLHDLVQKEPPTINSEKNSIAEFRNNRLHVIQPVYYQGRDYGTIYLLLSTKQLDDELMQYGLFLLVVAALLIVLAYLLANLLQGVISKPVQQQEEAHEQSEERLMRFFQVTSEGVFFHEDGKILDVNFAMTAISGYKPCEMLGQNVLQFIPPELRDDVREKMRSGTESTYETQAITKGGVFVPVELKAKTAQFEGRSVRVVSIQNISERKQAAQALQQAYGKLEEKVTERTRELAKANVNLKQEVEMRKKAEMEANNFSRTKSTFLANMSHELRTPLNCIIGFTSVLKDGMAGEINEEQARQLDMVYGSARHLLELINDILDLSKVESGKVKIVVTDFELMPLLAEIKALMQPLADAKGLELQLSGYVPELLHSDRRKLRQVLLNLLGNAIKFTEQGNVTLVCRQEGQSAIFEVTDTGIGISKEKRTKIFEAFEQADARTEREYEGTGLGLAISQRFVELLGGEITVRSMLNEGSTFRIVLHNVVRKVRSIETTLEAHEI